MSGYVLDASVAAKFVLDTEPHSQEAQSLLRAHRAGKLTFLAPDFFWFETANVLWKAVRRARISRSSAEDALTDLGQFLRIPTVASLLLREDALSIALKYNCAVYDAAYLALAMNSGQPLITADERLSSVRSQPAFRSNGSALPAPFHPNLEGCPTTSPLP